MNPKDFQREHGLTDEELDLIKHVCVHSKGTVSSIGPKVVLTKPGLPKIKGLVKGGTFKMSKSRSFYRGQWKRETSV